MPLTQFLTGMGIGTILGWISWLFVIFKIDPETSGIIGKIFFYASLFIAATGTASLLGFWSRAYFFKNKVLFSHLAIALRQGIWFAIVVVIMLILQSADLFKFWNMIVLALLFGAVEMFFLSREKYIAE